MLALPEGARILLDLLNAHGYQAYAVGGCVRDSLLNLTPKDWDLCTSALPEEMRRVFSACHVVETGLQHGTLTVLWQHVPYEVTTFRADGDFAGEIACDLARRDFTINAMAWHPQSGLVDMFHGLEDLRSKTVRCVGSAEERFFEDPLRILRALRFAACYDFTIAPATCDAIHALFPTLGPVAPERIRTELDKLLCGPAAGRILRDYADVITFILPEMKDSLGFDQRTPHHRFDVWEHTVRAVEAVLPKAPLRLAMLLHDSGKPGTMAVDENGIGHAYGHQKRSLELAAQALDRLKYDHMTRDTVLLLVEHHDIPLEPDESMLIRRLNQFGEEHLRLLIEVHRADAAAKGTLAPGEADAWANALLQALDRVLAAQPCFTLKQLAVRGDDLAAVSIPRGKIMGEALRHLLECVMEKRIYNERKALLQEAALWLARQNQASAEVKQ